MLKRSGYYPVRLSYSVAASLFLGREGKEHSVITKYYTKNRMICEPNLSIKHYQPFEALSEIHLQRNIHY